MAAKTVVCQECGSSAEPGRYACAECGALLASVAVAPRGWSDAEPIDPASEPDPPGGEASEPPVADREAVPEPIAVAEVIAGGPDTIEPGAAIATPTYVKLGRPRPTAPPPDLLADAGEGLPFDEDAPIGTAADRHADSSPDVRHDLPPAVDGGVASGEPIDDAEPIDDIDEGVAAVVSPESDSPPTPEPAPMAASPVVPGWPPPGDPRVAAWPEPRTPAGAYLPPSAVLPPVGGGSGAVAIGGTAAASTASAATGFGAGWADRGTAALAGAFDQVRVTAAASRRTMVIGSTIAALGILLPWINGLPTEGMFAGYLNRWGLAGPGMWLVLLGLIALAIVAGSSGRPEGWPIGLPSIAIAAFLGGLLWPYLVGGSGRSMGIWVVLVGALVLAVGGVLDRRPRHDGPEPGVSTG